jgi:uroporphyrin-III C-methyltransferase
MQNDPRDANQRALPGKVYLVGAGPGAADLITVRGARLLAQAGVVLHDALVTEDMLALCAQAIRIPVGKRSGKTSTEQAFINKQLIDQAHKHSLVVRLKGGDPMLFGRADEELTALEQAGIAVEIVPGITTALAAAAASKQPLTKRGKARSFALFTSSTAPGESAETRVPDSDTLVQYMGGKEAILTAQRLLAAGRPADWPVIAVENCSRPDQRILRLNLSDLEQGLAACEGPVLVMMGEAMRVRASSTKSAPGDATESSSDRVA